MNKEPFQKIIDRLKSEGKYRVFNDILRERGEYPNAIWYGPYNIKNIVNWCSNDYLGMGQHKVVIDAMHTALMAKFSQHPNLKEALLKIDYQILTSLMQKEFTT